MSRSLVLGNGNTLVCFDEYAQVRDLYFPFVGLENHVGRDLVHRIGVWVDGRYSWLSDGTWRFRIAYRRETMASDIVATNDGLAMRIAFTDIVYNEKDIFLRQASVENLGSEPRKVKLFFNQEFRISENEHADTAYYNPSIESVIHYKGRRVFLVGGQVSGRAFDEYSIGLLGAEGKEGTWRDAEDGMLSQNPIEHGTVDSVIGMSFQADPMSPVVVTYWICAAETFREAVALKKYLIAKTPEHLLETTQDFWHAWVNKANFSFIGLDPKAVELFKNSLLVIRAHADNRGGILASGDSGNFQQYGRDTYGYIWPRDGAFTALALDRAGYHDIAERFFAFSNDLITEEGYVLHKYLPDKSLGSSWHPWIKGGKRQLAIQEDETATLIFAFWEHYKRAKDLEFIESIYNNFIKLPAEFLMAYREPTTRLPGPSYDLWEETYGITTFTSASVYGALLAASYFASLLGKEEDALRFAREAEDIRNLIVKHLYNPETKYFRKLVNVKDGAITADETYDSSAFFGMLKFGVLPAEDERMREAHATLVRELSRNIGIGGIARYAGDKYFLSAENVPGNPWFITTMWALQFRIEQATGEEEMRSIAAEILRISDLSKERCMLSEQMDPQTGAELSVSPLTWSHAEYVSTVIAYMERMEKLGFGMMHYPVE